MRFEKEIKEIIRNSDGLDPIPYAIALIFMNKISRQESLDERLTHLVNDGKFLFNNITSKEDDYVNSMLDKLSEDELCELLFELFENKKISKLHNFDSHSSVELVNLANYYLEINSNDTLLDMCSGAGEYLVSTIHSMDKDKLSKLNIIGGDVRVIFTVVILMAMYIVDPNFDKCNITAINYLDKTLNKKVSKAFLFPPLGIKKNSNLFSLTGEELFNSRTSLEWVYVDRMLDVLDINGKGVAILTDKNLFSNFDLDFRKYLFKNNLIDSIIKLPICAVDNCSVNLTLVVFNKNKKDTLVKIIDASQMSIKVDGFECMDNEKIIKSYNKNPNKVIDTMDLYGKNDVSVEHLLIETKPIKNGRVLNEIADVFSGSQYTLRNFRDQLTSENSGYRILSSSDINSGIVDWNSLPLIEPNSKLDKFSLQKGDLVVTSKSSKVKFAYVDIDPVDKIIVTGGMIIVRPHNNELNTVFLKSFLESNVGQSTLKLIQKGTTIISINLNAFKNITIPCPSIKKQESLASKYMSYLSTLVALKEQTSNIEYKLNNLFDDEYRE